MSYEEAPGLIVSRLIVVSNRVTPVSDSKATTAGRLAVGLLAALRESVDVVRRLFEDSVGLLFSVLKTRQHFFARRFSNRRIRSEDRRGKRDEEDKNTHRRKMCGSSDLGERSSAAKSTENDSGVFILIWTRADLLD